MVCPFVIGLELVEGRVPTFWLLHCIQTSSSIESPDLPRAFSEGTGGEKWSTSTIAMDMCYIYIYLFVYLFIYICIYYT